MVKEKERIFWASELALKNIVENSFDDIFISGQTKHWGNLVEFDLIQHDKLQKQLLDEVRKDLISALNDQKSKRPSCLTNYQKYQNPKRSGLYAYRHAALLEPKTTLGYLSLAILFAEKIEKQRIPTTEQKIFSYRFHPSETTGQIFSETDNLGFKGFRKEEFRQRANKKNNFVLTADISHFYDTLNLHVLENELRDAAEEDRFLADRVTRWLDRFLQQTDGGWSRGIPVGNNASRILAEASLIGLDRRLKRTGINFIRFVDDFRIFTADPIEAQKALETLNQELNRLGLALNDGKVSLSQISDESREKGLALLSGQEINIDQADYVDRTPMTFRKTNKKSKSYQETAIKFNDAYTKYEAGELFTEQNEVKYLIRHVLESEDLGTKKKIVGIFANYLSFSKFICSYCEKDDTDFMLKEYIFEWFKKNILKLPNHSIHALFTMVSKEKILKGRAVQEILMNKNIRHQLDNFIFREAIIMLRTKLSKDDLEDLNQDILKFDNFTRRALAYCMWRGNQFNNKEKQIRLNRISENHSDIFLKFLSSLTHANFKSAVEKEK